MRGFCRWIHTGIVFFLFLFFEQRVLLGDDARKDSLALHHFKQGEAYVLQGDTARAIEELKEAVGQDRKLSRAYHRLGQLYLGLGKLHDRIQAQRYLDKALRLEPKNVSYLHTKVQWYFRIEAFGLARNVLKKIIRIDPDDADAYYYLGFIEEKKWFKYRDMVSPQENGVVLSLAGFAEKDLDRAQDYYLKAVRLNPQLSDGYYRLALLYYETDALSRMVTCIRDALGVNPDNKDYHLFLGMAYHRMGRFEEAWTEVELAKSLMQPEELALFEAVDLVSTPEGGEFYRRSSKGEKEELEYVFWKQRDPLFLTEMNERKLEHYSRIAYSNLCFSSARRGVEGWRTDRGKVYIRYGPPQNRYKTWPYMGASMGIGNPVCFSKAVWNYPGFEFVFEDRSLTQNYNFKWGVEDPDYLDRFNRMIRRLPERYEYLHPKKRFDLSCSVARFRDEEGRTVFDVYQSIPKEVMSSRGRGKRGIFLFDQVWREVLKRAVKNPFLTPCVDTFLVGWDQMQVDAGTYHLVVEFLDEGGGKIGRWMKDVTIEAYDDRNLAMSDLVLAWEIGDYREEGELRRGGRRIVPNTLGEYSVSSAIPLYFEIYNMAFSREGGTHYRFTFTVQSEEKKGGFGRFIGKLWGGGNKAGKVVTSIEYRGNRRNEKFYQDLTIEGALPRNYRIRVEVEDLNTEGKVSRQKTVGLMESFVK